MGQKIGRGSHLYRCELRGDKAAATAQQPNM
jgi:hypothetical protein